MKEVEKKPLEECIVMTEREREREREREQEQEQAKIDILKATKELNDKQLEYLSKEK